MTMNLRKLIPLALVGVAVAAAQGEGEREGAAARRAPMQQARTYLNLTDSQMGLLQQMQDKHKAALEAIQAQIAGKRRGLEQAQASSDANGLGNLTLEVSALRRQLLQAQQGYRDQVSAALTGDQRTKLQQLEEALRYPQALPALGLSVPKEWPGEPREVHAARPGR